MWEAVAEVRGSEQLVEPGMKELWLVLTVAHGVPGLFLALPWHSHTAVQSHPSGRRHLQLPASCPSLAWGSGVLVSTVLL